MSLLWIIVTLACICLAASLLVLVLSYIAKSGIKREERRRQEELDERLRRRH